MALAYPMTVDLLHRWILAAKNKNARSLDFKPEMDFFCVLRLTLMNAAFEWNTFDGFLKPISSRFTPRAWNWRETPPLQELVLTTSTNLCTWNKLRVYGLHDELMMEESGYVSQIWVQKLSHIGVRWALQQVWSIIGKGI